jgi:hypothetical protein
MPSGFQKLISGLRTRVSRAVEVLFGPHEKPAEPAQERTVTELVPEPTLEQLLYTDDELEFPEETGGPPVEEGDELEEIELEEELEDLENWEIIEESKNTRGPFATEAEAEAYADEIPVPTTVGKTAYGLFIVRVDYP